MLRTVIQSCSPCSHICAKMGLTSHRSPMVNGTQRSTLANSHHFDIQLNHTGLGTSPLAGRASPSASFYLQKVDRIPNHLVVSWLCARVAVNLSTNLAIIKTYHNLIWLQRTQATGLSWVKVGWSPHQMCNRQNQ